MVDAKAWVSENIDVVLAIVVGLLLLAIIMFVVNTVRLNQLHKRYRTLMKGLKHANLEEILMQYAEDVQRLDVEVKQVRGAQEAQRRELDLSIGPVGMVRYNAFPDAGSDLSYSVAILNRDADGVVMSSIFGREESRTYAKPVVAGASTYMLSEEEKQAIQKALELVKK